MFDFDAGKLLIIGLVALVVIGPKDLPRVLRQVGQAVGKLRRMAGEFQGQFMDAMKEADLQDLKTEIAKLKDSATLDVDFDPARDVKDHLTSAVSNVGPAGGSVGPALPDAAPGPHEFNLPALPAVEPETSLASAGIGPVGDVAVAEHLETVPAAFAEPLEAPPIVPDIADPGLPLPHAEHDVEPPTARRKIVVTRRRRLSRLDGPTLRAAVAERSRNILPARRDTTDQ